jgi:hypothetical protein
VTCSTPFSRAGGPVVGCGCAVLFGVGSPPAPCASSGNHELSTICELLWDNDLRHWGHLGSVGDPAGWPGFGGLPVVQLDFLRSFIRAGKMVPRSPSPARRPCEVRLLQKGNVEGVGAGALSRPARVGGPTAVLKELQLQGTPCMGVDCGRVRSGRVHRNVQLRAVHMG